MEIIDKVRTFKHQLKTRPMTWDEEILFVDSDLYFQDLLSGLQKAQKTIALETYIFSRGLLASRIHQALISAAQRGVKVEVLVDGIGSPNFWKDYGHTLTQSGVHVRLFRSWPWQAQTGQEKFLMKLIGFFRRWLWLNRGNHRKLCFVDGHIAWIGSMNISDVHLREVFNQHAWLDVGVRLQGFELWKVQHAFHSAMLQEASFPILQSKKSLIWLNSNLFERRISRHHQVVRLKKAQKTIWIQTPYFVPIGPLYRTLVRKARKGCDVRIIVPQVHDVPLIRAMSYAFFLTLLKAGVRIFEFEPRFPHQKIIHVDDWTTIGSTNLNHRSFFHDLEIDVSITHPENRQLLREKFCKEQEQSTEITVKDLERLSGWQTWWSRFLLLLRHWV